MCIEWWCHPAISSSVVPFSSCPQSLPASRSFPVSQLFTWGGQRIRVSASASAQPLPKSNQSDHCFLWHFSISINCLFLIWMNFWLHNWRKVKNIKSMDSALEAKLLILLDFCQQEPNKQSVIKAYAWAKCNLPFRHLAPYAFVDKEVSSFWISGVPFGGTPVFFWQHGLIVCESLRDSLPYRAVAEYSNSQ